LFLFTVVLQHQQPHVSRPRFIAGAGEVARVGVPGCDGGQALVLGKGVLSVVHDGLAVVGDGLRQVEWSPFEVEKAEQPDIEPVDLDMQVPVYPLVVVLDAKAVEQFVGDQSYRFWVLGVQARPADNQSAAG